MKTKILVLISALALAKAERVRVNRNGCPIDVTAHEALHPHENCNQYYQCVRGELIARDCPLNLLFNPVAQACDWPDNVDCQREAHEVEPHDTDGNSDPKLAIRICEASGSDGVLVAHEHCNQFYQCWNSKPVAISCYGNLHYNPVLEICDWPELVDCGARVIPENSDHEYDNNPNEAPIICASEGTEQLLVAHYTCNKFYRCHEGKPIAYRCPGHLLYNHDAGYCDCADNVICGDRVIEEDNENDSNNSAESDNNDAATICTEEESDGILIAHENCKKFYKCAHGVPVEFTCYGELLFNPKEGHCEWPGNVDCGERYIPEVESEEENNGNGGIEDKSTENGGSDKDEGSSENENNGDNGNNGNGHEDPSQAPDICAAEGSAGVLVAHENCNQFYMCDGGHPVTITCPGNLLFNPKTDACDWPQHVECGDRIIPEVQSEEDKNESTDNGDADNGGTDNGATDGNSSENQESSNENSGNSGNGHEDPSQAPDICAAEGSAGVLVAHENCNQFYMCDGGHPVTITCPGNLLFNPQFNACDWPEHVECGDRIIPEVQSEEDKNESTDNGDADNGGTDNGATDGNSSETEESSNENNGNSGNGHEDPSQAPDICAAEGSAGVLVAHENCNQFYMCDGGHPVTITCPGNLLFNPKTDACDWPQHVECGDRIIPEVQSEEDKNESTDNGDADNGGTDNGATDGNSSENQESSNENNGNSGNGHEDPSQAPDICAAEGSAGVLVAHENCNQFYICDGGHPVTITCPGNLLFNPQFNACDWPEHVECGDRIIPEVQSEEDNNESTDNGDADNGGTDNGATDGNSSETEESSNENNGNSGNGHEDPSQAPDICAAEGSAGVLVAHENCNQFYICDGGHPVTITCPGNLLFNPQTDACDWPQHVKCGDRLIPEVQSEEDNNESTDNGDADNGGTDNGATDDNSSENQESSNENNGNSGNGHEDPSQAPDICAAEGSAGVLVAHENCNQFYICDGSHPVTITCPGNLLFNPQFNACDWPEHVECGDRIIPEVQSEEDKNESTDNGDADNGGTDNGATDGNSSENQESSNENSGNSGNGHEDPSQAPDICAAEGSAGVLVAHENCNQFYICDGGHPVTITCPGNLLFNPQINACDWPEHVECGDRIIPEVQSEEDNNESTDNGDADNGGTDNGSIEGSSSENGGSDNGNTGNGNEDPSEAPVICAENNSEGVFVAHEHCNQFYVCVAGKPVTLDCPRNLLFNPITDNCDWPENVDCGDRIIPEVGSEEDNNGGTDNEDTDNGATDGNSSENQESSNENNGNSGNGHEDPSQAPDICAAEGSAGVLVAHENCNQFYICDGRSPVTITCPGNLLFNPQMNACDWPQHVECGDRIIPEVQSEEDNNESTDNGDADNEGTEGESSENNENTGNSHEDPSEAPAICAASGSEGVFVAHENCNQFYVCVAGKPVTLDCPGNLLFNPHLDQCDWPKLVNCGDRIVPEVGSEEDNNEGTDNGGNEGGSSENGGAGNGNTGNGHEDPSEAPTICAASGSEGVLVAHENCNQFYVCVGGKPTALKCPGTLLFNPHTDNCDWPENVKCGDRIIPEYESSEDNNGSGDTGGSDNGGADNGGAGNGNTGNGHEDPSEAPAICAASGSEGVLVAHENCNQFYVCIGGKPTALKCPGTLLFNPHTDNCDWPENVKCGDRIIPEYESSEDNNGSGDTGGSDNGGADNGGAGNGNTGNGHEDPSEAPAICAASGSEGVFVAHENCNQFYVCVAGKPVTLDCPGNLLFNPHLDQCDWPKLVNCGDRIIPEVGTEEDNNEGTDNGGNEGGSSENGGAGNGNTGNGHEDPSEAPTICAASGSEGVLVAHENCNQFYVCVGGKPTALKCPGTLLFNPHTDNCDWPENVKCGDRIIPEYESSEDNNGSGDTGGSDNGGADNGGAGNGNTGNGHEDPSEAPAICAASGSEGVFVAHENCNQFYVCVAGKPVTLDCPGNLLFNPHLDQCDWPKLVNCGDRIIPEVGSEEDNNEGSDNGDTEEGSSENGGAGNGNTGNGHENPSEAPAICAASGSEGVLVAHENCNQFYVCVGGKPTALKCPGTLLFNPHTDNCDWAENVICGDRIIPEYESSGDNNGSGDTGGSDNGGSDNGSVDNGGTDNGGSGNGNTGNGHDDPSQALLICAADLSEGVFVAHENCNQFYVCVGGQPVTLDCPGNLLFNPRLDQCDWPELVNCGDRIIPDPDSGEDNNGGSDNGDTEEGSSENGGAGNGNTGNGHENPSEAPAICAASGSEGVLVAHENCNQFYVCVGGKPTALKCPGTLLFNPHTDNCDWAENVICGDRIIPEYESSGDNNGSGDTGGSDNGGSDNGGVDNGGTDNGGSGNGNTGNGHDDPSQALLICAADLSEGVFVAHENCNQFYVCVGGQPVTLDCPGNLLFNPRLDQCDWPELVNCGDRIIPDPDSGEDNNGGSDNGDTEEGSSENGGAGNGNTGNGHENPSEAPAICAASGSEGVLVAHENCNQFYVCVGGKPTALKCPGTLLFNPHTDNCDWAENVICGDRIIPEYESSGDNNGSGDTGGSDNGGSDNGGVDNGGTDNGGSGNGNTGNGHDDPSQALLICAADLSEGVFVAHENCNQFYVCVGGQPVTLDCPGNLLFNPHLDQCDWPELVNCGDRIIPDPDSGEDNNGGSDNGDTEEGSSENGGAGNGNTGNGHENPSEAPAICAASGSEGVLVAHENCNQFYVCVGGKPTALKCPGTLLFNPHTDNCDWAENVICGDRIIPEYESSGDNNGSGDTGGSDNGGSDNGGVDNGGTDNGGSGNGNTGNGHDDPSQALLICAADLSEGVFVAHENCNQFYVCVGGQPVTLDCPGNLLFNPRLDQCDWPELVNCGDRIIPDPDSGEDNNGGSDNGDTEEGSSENGGAGNGNTGNGHENPSEAPAICAASGSEGVLVAHENCNQFYVCVGGKPTALKCPGTLLFNPHTDNCDWAENVICGDRIIPEYESSGDNNGSGDTGGSDNGGSDNGGVDNGGTDNGGSGNGNTGNGHDDPSQALLICAADLSEGVFVAHENCNQFYVCVGGQPVTLDCPGNLLFNPHLDQCDWPELVNCGDRIIPDPDSGEDNNGGSDNGDTEEGSSENGGAGNGNTGNGHENPSEAPAICAASGSEGVLVAHENCNQFYVCVGGKPTALKCPGTLLFNPHTDNCDWAENVICGDRIIPEYESSGDNNGSGDTGGSDNGGSDNGGVDNGGTDNGGSGNGNTGNGHDDPSQALLICAADLSEGVFVAHENCNQFYVCVGGQPVTLDCPGNLLFNPHLDQCDWPELVNCGDRIIPDPDSGEDNNGGSDNGDTEEGSSENGGAGNGNTGNGHENPSEAPAICAASDSEGVLVAHENCNQFYVCVGGKPTALKCPGTLLFNPHTDNCDWAENVICGDRIIPEYESSGDNNGSGDTGGSNDGGSDNGGVDNGGTDNGGSGNGNTGNGHDDPSQALLICAADLSEGVFVAHENCNQFYVCVGGQPFTLDCPGNLLFNPHLDQCDWPELVNCGDRIIPEAESEEDNNGGTDNGGIDNGGTDNGSTDNGGSGNGNSHDDPSQAPAICAADLSDGVFVAHENCNQFYVCVGGLPVTLDCPSGLLYNSHIERCDWKDNVICGDRVLPENNSGEDSEGDEDGGTDNGGTDNGGTDNGGSGNGNGHDDPSQAPAICAADLSEGVFVAHENCNQFYICVGGKPETLDCPENLLFNPHSDQCDWPELVNCGDRIIPETESEEDNNGGSDNGGTDNGGTDNGSTENGGTDNGDSGNGGGTETDNNPVAICAASKTEIVFIAHENCSQFYICQDGLPVTLDCPLDLMYDPVTEQCDWPTNVDCSGRFVPEIDDTSEEKSDSGVGEDEDINDNDGIDNGNGIHIMDPIQLANFCSLSSSAGIFLPHKNCNQFYVCVGQEAVVLDCPENLFYNHESKQCDWSNNVSCDGRVLPGENDENNANQGSDNDENSDTNDNIEGIDSGNSHLHEQAVISCNSGSMILLPHADCNKFYTCLGNQPFVLQCAADQLFDAEKKLCDQPENVDCGSRASFMAMSLNKHLESRMALRNKS